MKRLDDKIKVRKNKKGSWTVAAPRCAKGKLTPYMFEKAEWITYEQAILDVYKILRLLNASLTWR